MLRNFYRCVVMALLAGAPAFAQCSSVPAKFAETCAQVQRYLSLFETTVDSQWDGKRTPVAFSTELRSANDNRGLRALLRPGIMQGVRREMDALSSRIGVQAVTIAVGFPTLYPPFYEYNKDPQDYPKVLDFYKGVMAEARQRGLRVVIETSVVFPAEARDLPLDDYYATLSESSLIAGRSQVALTIAKELQPDWLNLGSEPDTQSALLRLRPAYSAAQYAKLVSAVVAHLRKAGISGKPLIGAGIGSWEPNGTAYVRALAGAGVDYIDLHVFTINSDFIANTIACLEAARAAGKRVAISEAWLKKVTDADLQGGGRFHTIKVLSAATLNTSYSFWSALDSRFIEVMVKLANWKNLYYLSPIASNLMFAYSDYDQASTSELSERRRQDSAAELAAFRSGTLSGSGKAYAAAIAGNRQNH